MSDIYFFDTYAFVEIVKGNRNYDKYTKCTAITTIFNLMELYYALLRDFDKNTADSFTDKYAQMMVSVSLETVKKAMTFRLKNKGLSYVDCVGYTQARDLGVIFLTGDMLFKGLEGVEFVR